MEEEECGGGSDLSLDEERGPAEGPKSKLEEKQGEQDIISKFKHESLSLESRYRRCLR